MQRRTDVRLSQGTSKRQKAHVHVTSSQVNRRKWSPRHRKPISRNNTAIQLQENNNNTYSQQLTAHKLPRTRRQPPLRWLQSRPQHKSATNPTHTIIQRQNLSIIQETHRERPQLRDRAILHSLWSTSDPPATTPRVQLSRV